ncbi:hypothetical protein FRC10_010720 [Ceratobasidium sp. 414]|nr:hypothetical protein FRC10_010720 [Ceratobasidium sp. 414]
MDDVFAELLLADPEDEQPQVTSREARIARAFEQSKKSYGSEVVITPPGWFQIDHVQADDSTKLEARNAEWSVQRLYLQKSYTAALQLAIEVLHAGGVELDLTNDTSAILQDVEGTKHDIACGILAKNEARDREMLDVAIRLTVPHSSDAISALLHAVRARTPSFSILSLLVRALNAAAENSEPHITAFKKLADIIGQYAERVKPAFERGLFPPEVTLASHSKPPPKSKSTILPEAAVRTMGEEVGLSEADIGLLVALCCTGEAEREDGAGERSVRSL